VLGVLRQEEVEREEAAHEVLRQLHPVDPADHLLVADARLERGERGGALGPGSDPQMSSGSEASGDTKVVGSSPASSRADAEKSAAQRWVWNPQARWAARPDRIPSTATGGRARSQAGGRRACG